MENPSENFFLERELQHLTKEYRQAPDQLRPIILDDIQLIKRAIHKLIDQ